MSGLILSWHNSSTVDGYRDLLFVAVQFWVEGRRLREVASGGRKSGEFFLISRSCS
jgi:hypothetical protein